MKSVNQSVNHFSFYVMYNGVVDGQTLSPTKSSSSRTHKTFLLRPTTTTMADDAIMMLMQEMGEQQYGGRNLEGNNRNHDDDRRVSDALPKEKQLRQTPGENTVDNNTNNNNNIETVRRRPRLIREITDYPNNEILAGSRCIWNPYVEGLPFQSGSPVITNNDWMMLPTNPDVEIVRRRSFEKFRQDMQEMLDRMISTWEKQYQDQQVKHNPAFSSGNSSKNSRLSIPVAQMIEKFVMDAKLKERENQRKRNNKGGRNVAGMSPPFYSVSTIEILRRKTRLLSSNHQIYDPILLSQQAPSIFIETIVRPQVQKSWQTMVSASQSSSTPNRSGSSAPNLPTKFEKKASQIRKATYKFIVDTHESFDKQLQSAASQEMNQSSYSGTRKKKQNSTNKRLPKISYDDLEIDDGNNRGQRIQGSMVRVTFKGNSFKLHSGYLEKLQRLYDRGHLGSQEGMTMSFEEALFCLLCRYDTIQGAGLQASVPGSVMDVLLNYFDCRLECFASPLNCRYDRYCSAFEDVDVTFGSHGSFFNIPDKAFLPVLGDDEDESDNSKADKNLETRCYEANPPFCEELIKEMDSKINRILSLQGKSPVMFVVIVPAWTDAECYQGLLKNPFLTHHLILKQRKHYYAEGTQHRRKDSFRVASFDTSVLFYQNDSARYFWPLDGGNHEAAGALKNAFEENPGTADKTGGNNTYSSSRPAELTSTVATSRKPLERVSEDMKKKKKKDGKKSDRNAFKDHKDRAETIIIKKKEQHRGDKKNKEQNKKKRSWTEQEGEGEAQMKLLQSLGIAPSTDHNEKRPSQKKHKAGPEASNTSKTKNKKKFKKSS